MRYLDRRNANLFDDMFDDMFRAPVMSNNTLMKTDIHEKDGKYILDIEVPGVKKEDVKISLYNGNLTVAVEHNESNEEKDAKGNLVRSERNFGSCSRSFYVGDNIKAEDVKAKFENGMLQVTVPSAKQKQIESTETISIE